MTARLRTVSHYITQPLNLFVLFASIIPLIFVLAFIRENAQNVPYWDQWSMSAEIALKTEDGSLTFGDLIQTHNEHRIFFSNVLTAGLTILNGWDTRYEMIAIVGLTLVNLLLVLALFAKQHRNIIVVILPFSMILLALRQAENWLWGFQTQWYFVTFFLLAALVVLTWVKREWVALGLAAFFSLCATFAFSAGLTVWPLLFVGIWLMGYRKPAYFVFWAGASIVSLSLFFIGYELAPSPGGETSSSILSILQYIAIYLSGPLLVGQPSANLLLALIIGIGGLAFLNSIYLWAVQRSPAAIGVWWVLAGFAFGGALLAGVRRAQLGIYQAGSSRYVAISVYFWLMVVALAVLVITHVMRKERPGKIERLLVPLNTLVLVVISGMYIQANFIGYDRLPILVRDEQASCVRLYPVTGNQDCLVGLFPNLDYIVPIIDEMAANDLGIFADSEQYQVALNELAIQPIGEHIFVGYQAKNINDDSQVVLLQHAPSQGEQSLQILPVEGTVVLETAVWVDTTNLISDPNTPQDGVDFTLNVIDAVGDTQTLLQRTVDPNVAQSPVPAFVDLSPYKGQNIRLQFITDERENPSHDWAMWVQPTIREIPPGETLPQFEQIIALEDGPPADAVVDRPVEPSILTTDLSQLPIVSLNEQLDTGYRREMVAGRDELVLVQHAPSQITQTITLPEAETISFSGAVIIQREGIPEDVLPDTDGVVFRVSTLDAEGAGTDGAQLLYEQVYDPRTMQEAIPFSIDLSAYAGQTLRLLLETDQRGLPIYDRAVWVAPRIEVDNTSNQESGNMG